MPIYEYACRNCSHTLDALQKISDEPLRYCPSCGKPELKRLISAPRFRLKGEGWYETDFKKDNKRNVLKGDSEPAKPEKSEPASSKSGEAAGAGESKKAADTEKSSNKKSGGAVDSA